MSALSIEMLSPARVTELWPVIEPLLQASCESNEIAKDEMDTRDIYVLTQTDLCVIFLMSDEDGPGCIVALQFNDTNGRRGADVIAMGGRSLLRFKTAYWAVILDWLRANGVKFLDAYANERLGRIYASKFGFEKSCTYVRMIL